MGNTHSSAGIGVGGWLIAIVAAPFTGGSSIALTAAVAGGATVVGGVVGFAANAVQNRDGTVDDFTSGVGKGIVIPLAVATGADAFKSNSKRSLPEPIPVRSTNATTTMQTETLKPTLKPPTSSATAPVTVKPTRAPMISSSSSASNGNGDVKQKTYAIYDPAKRSTTIASTRTTERCDAVRSDNGLQKCSVQRDTTYTTTDGKLLKTRTESGLEFRNTRTGTSQSVVTGSSLDLATDNPATASQVHVASTVNRKYVLESVPVTVKAVKSETSLLGGHVQVATTSTGYSTRTEVSISKNTAKSAVAAIASIPIVKSVRTAVPAVNTTVVKVVSP